MCTSMGRVFYISTFDSHNKWKTDPQKTCRGREKEESHQNPGLGEEVLHQKIDP